MRFLKKKSNFSDTTLEYISQMLLEEEAVDSPFTFHDHLALEAAAKSFYDVLTEDSRNWAHQLDHSNKVELGDGSKVRKHDCFEDNDFVREERTNKHAAGYASFDIDDQLEMFDKVLLLNGGNESDSYGEINTNAKHGNKHRSMGEDVDLNKILTHCAEAVSLNDLKTANETLKLIRRHSFPSGNASQRLAHYFANGLESRIAGTGAKLYKDLTFSNCSAAEILKTSKLYIISCPFKNVSQSFAIQTITELLRNATRLYIIHFCIQFSYHMPSIIEGLSNMPGGPPKLRVTGIEAPQSGFRPMKMLEQTGHLLAKYCERFKVPSEYTAIAKQWGTKGFEDR